MANLFDGILVMILALNLLALGSRSIMSVIRLTALQGFLLGVLPLIMHTDISVTQTIAAVAAIAIKGSFIPIVMNRAMENVHIKREVEPLIGFVASIILGAIVTGLVFLMCNHVLGEGSGFERMIIPSSITTVLVGFVLLITRYKAITQVMGYLVLENGIYIFSLLLLEAIPLVVEMGMLLDLFVSIFVISIITTHINAAFSSLDTRRLTSLRE